MSPLPAAAGPSMAMMKVILRLANGCVVMMPHVCTRSSWYLWRVHSLVNKQARYRRIGIA
jgi:hypothetical protein